MYSNQINGRNVLAGPGKTGLLGLFEYLRYRYCEKEVSGIKRLLEKAGITVPGMMLDKPEEGLMRRYVKDNGLSWGDVSFHLKHRITNMNDLLRLKPDLESRKDTILNVVRSHGYLLSILPMNLLMPMEVLENFIPPFDYCEPHPTKRVDPYGIFLAKAKVVDRESGLLLGSRKFKHSFLMNIHGECPIGCSDCYKAYYTREEHKLGVTLETLPEQTTSVVDFMNRNADIYDVIISGGEPLLASNSAIGAMLRLFEKARRLRVLRICTGTIFLGLPMRVDDQLVKILKDFSGRTGVVTRFHANLYNHIQITPEAILAVQRIKAAGLNVYSQVPIKEGVNFFSDDEYKTLDFLKRLSLAEVSIGVEPYKFIVDMHPRTNTYYVPIEPLIRVWSIFAESHGLPEIGRPRTLSILYREGNILLSGHLLLSAKKEVDKRKKLVRYHIPVPFGGRRAFTYEEPLLESNSDPQSLEKLRKMCVSKTGLKRVRG